MINLVPGTGYCMGNTSVVLIIGISTKFVVEVETRKLFQGPLTYNIPISYYEMPLFQNCQQIKKFPT